MITISEYLSVYKQKFSTIKMKESSWGEGGHFQVWLNPEHGWIWPYINSSVKQFEDVVESHPTPGDWEQRVLKQTARELLLMEGSDWPFLLYTKQAKDYANQRFHKHHQFFNKLIWAAKNLNDKTRLSVKDLENIESMDSCFQDLNLKYFKRIKPTK
jgi:1,4-alpha-glucan branching enzyme